ncbi:MAG TPA: hypothetical protein VNA04_17415 [Thermoanaerobaculia bacterium]|nr:hypothetical protein [Thermoanaerobaculia bacterium]
MEEWMMCPHCGLKHRQRSDGNCPRCKQPVGEEAMFDGNAAPGWAGAGGGALPDVYDGQPAPGSQLEQEAAASGDPADSPWFALVGGLALLWCAYYLHGVFGELESGARESVRVWWGVAILYNLMGATVTVALVGFLGAIMTFVGMRKLTG